MATVKLKDEKRERIVKVQHRHALVQIQSGKAEGELSVLFTQHTGAAGGGKSTNTPGVWCTTELCLGVLYLGIG